MAQRWSPEHRARYEATIAARRRVLYGTDEPIEAALRARRAHYATHRRRGSIRGGLVERVAKLEGKVGELEQRIRALEDAASHRRLADGGTQHVRPGPRTRRSVA